MVFRTFTLVFVLTLCALRTVAQPVTTGNGFVSATVDQSTGLISIYQGTTNLTYPGTSYLSVKIDGRYYTNNAASAPTSLSDPLGTGTSSHSPDDFLDSGTTTKIGDRIKTVWHDSTNNLDIIQTVYPVAFGASGQIVISVSVVSAQAHIIQGQYLIDDETGVQANPFILNSNSYDAHSFNLHSTNVPSFYMEMQNNPATPGTIGMIFLNDSFAPAPMGLIPANALYHIDWDVVSDYTFGAPVQNGTTSDMASLIQWPTLNAKAGTTEILRFSIGTTEAQQCSGSAVAYNFFPKHMIWNDADESYTQNPVSVLSLIYNSTSGTITNLSATQTVTSPLKALPNAQLNGGQLSPGSAVAFLWRDSILAPSGCNGTVQVTLSLDASGNGLSSPGLGSCSSTITIDCPPIKTHRPLATTLSTSGSYDGSACNMRTTFKVARDTGSPKTGLKSITTSFAKNMQVIVEPFAPVTDSLLYRVVVIDTMQDGIIVVSITDTSNVTTRDTTRYCTIPDTTKPKAYLYQSLNQQQLDLVDSGAWQRGIDSVFVTDTANIVILPYNHSGGCKPVVTINARPRVSDIARALVHAIDCAGNELKYPLFISPSDGVSQAETRSRIRVFPNPTTDAFTLELPSELTRVEIIDALGRTVAVFTAQGAYTFDAGTLGAGTYFLHAANTYIRFIKQ